MKNIDNNADIVCITPTANDKGVLSPQFIATATRFNINSFKDILENSISNHYVILPREFHDFPPWIQQRLSPNRADKSDITTALVTYYRLTSLHSLLDMSSIETLFINHKHGNTIDLGSISLLPRLQRLEVLAQQLKLGPHPSLKSLKVYINNPFDLGDLQLDKCVSLTELSLKSEYMSGLEPGILPSSLTSLTLSTLDFPRDSFLSLTSLVYLKININHLGPDEEIEDEGVQEQLFIDLETLSTLKTLIIRDYHDNDPTEDRQYGLEITVPPSLTILHLIASSIQIPTKCTMPLLEKLYIRQSILVGLRFSLSSCGPSLKKLALYECLKTITTIIPPTIEKLSIYKYEEDPILDQIIFPPSLTHLTIRGFNEPVQLPPSLIKLHQNINKNAHPLPQHLKKLVWDMDEKRTSSSNFEFTTSYPPNLETLQLFDVGGDFTIDIPSITKHLSISLTKLPQLDLDSPSIFKLKKDEHPIFSIGSRISKTISQSQQWLPINTTHLTCNLRDTMYNLNGAFRLDEVINHTNVRLDPDNNNVLVLETKSLQGGTITQQRTKSDDTQTNNQQQQQYDPIYLYFDTGSTSPFDLNWSFLHSNSGLRRSIRFKGIEAIDEDEGEISKQFKSTATRFKLLAFKDILENSVSSHQLILHRVFKDYPQWIQQRISLDRADTSNITTALVTYHRSSPLPLESLYDIPSIETLFINQITVDLNHISCLSNLQRLSVHAHKLKLGPHTTLKSLKLRIDLPCDLCDLQLNQFVSLTELTLRTNFVSKISPGILPSSLTSLTLRTIEIPPRDTFLSLTSLVYLNLDLKGVETEQSVYDEVMDEWDEVDEKQPIQQLFLDLESLSNLKTLIIGDDNDPTEDKQYSLEITVPPSLIILHLFASSIQIPTRCKMPLLEKLYVQQCILDHDRLCLSSSCGPSLKKLALFEYLDHPENKIPSTVEKLSIYKLYDENIDHCEFPPSLTHLSVKGGYINVQLPDTLIKLKQHVKKHHFHPLPRQLKKLVWHFDREGMTSNFEFPFNYPPHVETLQFFDEGGDYRTAIPSVTKHLSITLTQFPPKQKKTLSIFSIGSKLALPIYHSQWLPSNTTHLNCHLKDTLYDHHGAFRLDQVINNTNVRYLNIIVSNQQTFQFTIQRLDKDNINYAFWSEKDKCTDRVEITHYLYSDELIDLN
ncbi:hypothetical protein DFA_08447 [Cavenderia fasciculata]|uniref:Uncharacterized protein n=1 Tax=Cavenderia fasciculata TaxID=261658 RepID=F4Q678_CACFS|nr:uncharacterized protein DFA_08447 [Cavenderia fasciculata]EGG17452.1 hypothetical protein DFA_08447 [Cavenderia fasciculata]|eukprot:XP_004355936.1 hypothetical protein DFA_08447 [Cavenderia fasciculata]